MLIREPTNCVATGVTLDARPRQAGRCCCVDSNVSYSHVSVRAGRAATDATGRTVAWLNAGMMMDMDGDARPARCLFDMGADELIISVACNKRVCLPLMLKNH